MGGGNPDLTPKIIALSDRAIELDPHNLTAYIAKAIYYIGLDDQPNEAIRIANAASRSIPIPQRYMPLGARQNNTSIATLRASPMSKELGG
jgi:hypothetical protein